MYKRIILTMLALVFVFSTIGESFALDKGNNCKGKYTYRKVYNACFERGGVESKVPPISPADKDKQFGNAGNSLNNFCISTNKNTDRRCLACHPGWGTSTDKGINCLFCHSHKEMNWDESVEDIAAFLGAGDEDSLQIAREIQAELREAVQGVGRPERKNCGSCHFYGGGGDGVKHGDLDTSLAKPNKELDVHMGVGSQNFDCVRCHTTTLYNSAGRVYTLPAAVDRKSLVEDDLASKITCESCHTRTPHKAGSKANDHTDRVACQSCHIPEFARVNPTKMSSDWGQAGKTKARKLWGCLFQAVLIL